MDRHVLQQGPLRAEVARRGAELQSFAAGDRELLWDGDPRFWGRRAPILFPVVGRLSGDLLRHDGAAYPMPQHGFARDLDWDWTAASPEACALVLRDGPLTRPRYPFAFELEVRYRLEGGALVQELDLRNPGAGPLPASLGLHPAFRWPLAPGLPKEGHRLRFAAPEPGPARRLVGGLLDPEPRPNPAEDGLLPLSEARFAEDALVLPGLRSRGLRYEAPDGTGLDLAWEGFPDLGLWSKPGAGFLCVEPWQGHADPVGFEGPIEAKPGVVTVPPGGSRTWSFRVRPV